LLYALAQHGDLGVLPDIAVALRARMGQTTEAATRVEIVSALPLTEAETALLTEKLVTEYGRGLEFQYRVEPAILGGLIIRVGDKLIDGSVASRLAAMKQALGVTSG
jgi:ATP synthase F1 delta subunit